MYVIFLDIDGVLNCKRTPNPRKLPYMIDPRLLKRFTDLVARTGVEVVLSSTWRYDPAGLFSAKHWGIPFIDAIPDMPERPRRDEILAWLAHHPNVERYVVIDDDDDELDDLPLFQPSPVTGLSDEIVEGVVDYLTGIPIRICDAARSNGSFKTSGDPKGPSGLMESPRTRIPKPGVELIGTSR